MGRIDVFNNLFQPTTVSGSFIAPNLPAGFTPYNIQTVNGKLYVEYAKQFSPIPGGFIGVFDLNGNLLPQIGDAHLNSPWGITLAPATFGQFGGDLLVGNFGDGRIGVYHEIARNRWGYRGALRTPDQRIIEINGLWGLEFGNAGPAGPKEALYFTAGPHTWHGETVEGVRGLFGTITASG